MVLLALMLVGLAIVWLEHKRGHFALLKAELKRPAPPRVPPPPQPGGQDVIVLERSQIEGGRQPEFLSATLLPGRGMNVLQIKAFVPLRGEVKLLASPTLDEAASQMNGKGSDANGAASLAMGGAIDAPWARRIFGTPADGELSVMSNGRTIHLPAEGTTAQQSRVGAAAAARIDYGEGQCNARMGARQTRSTIPATSMKTGCRVCKLTTAVQLEQPLSGDEGRSPQHGP